MAARIGTCSGGTADNRRADIEAMPAVLRAAPERLLGETSASALVTGAACDRQSWTQAASGGGTGL
jgi:hypothetical protein